MFHFVLSKIVASSFKCSLYTYIDIHVKTLFFIGSSPVALTLLAPTDSKFLQINSSQAGIRLDLTKSRNLSTKYCYLFRSQKNQTGCP